MIPLASANAAVAAGDAGHRNRVLGLTGYPIPWQHRANRRGAGLTTGGSVELLANGMAYRRAEIATSWMRQEAAEWGVSLRTAWILAAGPILFAALVALTALDRPLYRAFVNEDALVEWVQFATLVALIPLGSAIAIRLWRRRERSFAIVFALAAVAAAFIAGEEISWGQRLLGWATPEELALLNNQGETNIHNIGEVLAFMNLGMFLVTVVAGVIPFVWRWGAGGRPRDVSTLILVPPLFLATSFLFAGAFRLFRYALMPEAGYVVSRYGEVGELLLYGALLAYAFLLYRKLGTITR
jgi:hypothetical protein